MKSTNLDKLTQVQMLLASKTRTGQSLKLKKAMELVGEILVSEVPAKPAEPVTIEDERYDKS